MRSRRVAVRMVQEHIIETQARMEEADDEDGAVRDHILAFGIDTFKID